MENEFAGEGYLDSRNIQERIDELKELIEAVDEDDANDADDMESEKEELTELTDFKNDVDSSEWDYGIDFIEEYEINREQPTYSRGEYTSVEFGGYTYYYR